MPKAILYLLKGGYIIMIATTSNASVVIAVTIIMISITIVIKLLM